MRVNELDRSGAESFLEFIDAFSELDADVGFDSAPGSRMFGLAFVVEGAGCWGDFSLDLCQVGWIDWKDDAWRGSVSG